MIVSSDKGLQWKKIDLHIHTPASHEKQIDNTIKAKDIIEKAQSIGLDAICISDHNSGEWVDKLKEESKGKNIVVFPGVEITVQGGKTNVHILGVFDPSVNTEHINMILSKLDIPPGKRGDTDVIASKTVNETIDIITDKDGIALLAHADSSSGVLNDMKGIGRRDIIRNPNLLGAHITNEETSGFLDGKDPTYKRRLATFIASDAHLVEEIGDSVTFFKMGSIDSTSLRQCFTDPDVRIKRQPITKSEYPKIEAISFSQGFLVGQVCMFHPGLNSIIGGKGVGKSLIVDFMRFALNQPSPTKDIKKDMNGKLSKRLTIGGSITVTIVTTTGDKYKVTRIFDGIQNPTTIENIKEGSIFEGSLPSLFPILVYSQNEIIDIARDTSAQLSLIDKFIGIRTLNSAVESVRAQLKKNMQEYIQSLQARNESLDVKRDIDTLEAAIKGLNQILNDSMFNQKSQWERKKSTFEAFIQVTSELDKSTQLLIDSLVGKTLQKLHEDDKEDTNLISANAVIQPAIQQLSKDMISALNKFRASVNKASDHKQQLIIEYDQWEKEYDKFIEKAGGQKSSLAKQRTLKIKRLKELENQLEKLQKDIDAFEDIDKKRQQLLSELSQAINYRYEARKKIYRYLTDSSKGKLKLDIHPQANTLEYAEALIELASGNRIRSEHLRSVAEHINPDQFVKNIINKNVARLISGTDLNSESAERLINSILSDEDKIKKCLSLPFDSIPGDVPSIGFKKDDGEYYPLSELSVGQKCTALLLIALSEGTMPVIVDQPEDALDIATVYEDVVAQLRSGKEGRQFVLTTHNPNIAVSSDSDKYHVLKAKESVGEITFCGSIDNDSVRHAVIDHLEGGIGPYTLRGKKYGLTIKGKTIEEMDS